MMKRFKYKSILRAVLFVWLILIAPQLLRAEGNSLVADLRVYLGANIGGTTPIGLPCEIRSINSYRPTFNPSIGIDAVHLFNSKWGVSMGARVERKGMKTEVDVRQYMITVNVQDGDAQGSNRGYFTGKVKNNTHHWYFTIPVLAVFRPSDNWEFRFGPYFAYAFSRNFDGNAFDGVIREDFLSPKVAVKMSDYDYGSDVRRFDAGLQLGGSIRIWKKLFVNADLTFGLRNTLSPEKRCVDISTYNIYLNLGLGYRF